MILKKYSPILGSENMCLMRFICFQRWSFNSKLKTSSSRTSFPVFDFNFDCIACTSAKWPNRIAIKRFTPMIEIEKKNKPVTILLSTESKFGFNRNDIIARSIRRREMIEEYKSLNFSEYLPNERKR